MTFSTFHTQLLRRFSARLMLAALFAAGVSVSTVALLGISGWFLTGAAVAGAGGPILIAAFNYLLPSAAIRFFAIARTVLRYGERYTGHSAALRAMADLRPALLERVFTTNPEKALRLSRGETSGRFIQDVTVLENALVMRSAPWGGMAGVSMALLLTGLGNIWAALVLALFLAATLAAGIAIYRLIPDDAPSDSAAIGALKARFMELMTVLPDIRAYDLREPLLAELNMLEQRLFEAKTRLIGKDALSTAANMFLMGLCLPLIALICLKGPLPSLALALLAATMGFEAIGQLTRAIGQNETFADAKGRIAEVFDQPQTQPAQAITEFSFNRHTFQLDQNLRLRIDGPTGSGKTRLVETLVGLRERDDIQSGAFALCPQDAAPLTGTIRDNLNMAFNDNELKASSDADLWKVLDIACLKSRIEALPKGLDTWVGDGGIVLSGGERKRLALARALLRKAPVLILDEPTEGLDLATEARVVANLALRLREKPQGLILISHREAPRALATEILSL